MEISTELNLCLSYRPANLFTAVSHEELNPSKDKYKIVHSNFIHTTPILESSVMPINRRMETLRHIHVREYNRKKNFTIQINMGQSCRYNEKLKNPVVNVVILYDSMYVFKNR